MSEETSPDAREFQLDVTYAGYVETEDGRSILLQRLTTLLSRVGEFWLNRSYIQQIVLVLLLLLAKNAFDIELRNIQEAYLPGAQEFPRAVGYFSASFGQVIITHGLGVTTTTQWVVLHAVLIAIALGVAFYLISNADHDRRSFMILVLASATATSSLFVSVGKYDVVTYLGAVILALSRTLPVAGVGAFLMASGNPEQAVVASFSLLALSVASQFRGLRTRALTALGLSSATWIGVQLWLRASDVSQDRSDLIGTYLSESISQVVAFPGTAVWSWLNAGWLVVLISLLIANKKSRKWLVLSLIVIPAAVTVITADGARVYGLIVLPSFLMVGCLLGRTQGRKTSEKRITTGSLLIAVVILPSVVRGPGWFIGQLMGLPLFGCCF